MPDELFPYQHEASDRGIADLATFGSTLIIMATGLGKTPVLATIARHYGANGNVLVLEGREHLVHQTAKQVHRWSKLSVGIEMDNLSCADPALRPKVVVASVQTLSHRSRLEAYEPGAFSLVIVDECHHALSPSYLVVFEYFPVHRLGTTATPDRHDGQALGQVFKSVAFRMDMPEGIRGGWLVPLFLREVRIGGLDFTRVRTTAAGDLNEDDLERIFVQEEHLQAVAVPIVTYAGRRRTIVFACTVLHAQQLAAVLNRIRPGSAVALHGKSPDEDRDRALAEFKAGKVQFLVNCGLYLEGFDEPSIECIAIARPTESRLLYVQMVGRGTRRSPETGKRDLLVLDFVGNAGKHQLVSALDILGGDMEPRVREEARLAAEEGASVLDAIDAARARAAAEDAARREIEEERRRGIVAEVRSQLVEVPTGFETGPAIAPVRLPANGVTLEQVVALRRFGLTDEVIASFDYAQATLHIDRAIAKSRGEPPSPMHARILADNHIDPSRYNARSAADLVAAILKSESHGSSTSRRPPPRSPPRRKGRRPSP